jgi:hypothetical protein
MSGSLIPNAKQQFLDSNGNPLAGGFVYYYIPSTTTFKNTYQNAALTILNTNPIILDSAGECIAYGAGSYRQIVTDVNGNLIWDQPTLSLAVNDASNVIYTPPFTNSVAETVTAKLSESISVKDFGAVGNGSTDDTTAIQNAINSAQSLGKALLLNEGSYLISSSLTISSQVSIYGEGITSKLIVKSTVGSTIDAVKIVPTAAIVGINLSNFAIQPQSGNPGRHAISVDITTYAVSYCNFTNLWLYQLGGRGFATIPNATPLVDGFFTSTISDSVIYGGIYLNKAGDSLRIERNTILGSNVGIYVDLVFGAFDQGAHGLLIDSNNITSNGGTLYVLNGTSGVFSNNNCELPSPSGVANSAMVDIAGTAGTIVNDFVIINNYIGSANPPYSPIRFNYTRNCLCIGNYVARPINIPSYVITANSVGARFLQNCDAIDEVYTNSSTGLFYDNGVGTSLIRAFNDNLQFTNNFQFVKTNKTINWPDSAGNVISCLGLSAVDNFFYVGAKTATATSAGMVFLINGVEVGRFNPAGGFKTNVYTYATLPTLPTQGTLSFVSDATATTFYSVVSGGGSNAVPVFFDGTVWRIG